MKRKKLLTLLLSTALIATIGIGSTLAYFTDNDAATNTITTGKVDISMTEGFKLENLVPGDSVEEKAVVKVETGSVDSYLRVKMEVLPKENVTLTEEQVAAITKVIEGSMDAAWVYSETNGYYYYNANEGTAVADTEYVFYDGFKLPVEWGNEYASKGIEIKLYAEAIQKAHFSPYRNANTGNIYAWYEEERDPSLETAEPTDVAVLVDGAEASLEITDGMVTLPMSGSVYNYSK